MQPDLHFTVKRYIVQRLAQYDTPTDVVKAVKEEFGLELTRQRVHYYDPTTRAGAALASELKALFETTRKDFLEQIERIPIANPAVRLTHLNRQLEKVASLGNAVQVKELCEAAAKEVGGFFTNRREISGPGGKPIQTEDKTPPAPAAGDIRDQFAQLLNAAVVDAAATAERAPASDPVLQPDSAGGGEAQPGDVPASVPVAVPQRPVLPAGDWMSED